MKKYTLETVLKLPIYSPSEQVTTLAPFPGKYPTRVLAYQRRNKVIEPIYLGKPTRQVLSALWYKLSNKSFSLTEDSQLEFLEFDKQFVIYKLRRVPQLSYTRNEKILSTLGNAARVMEPLFTFYHGRYTWAGIMATETQSVPFAHFIYNPLHSVRVGNCSFYMVDGEIIPSRETLNRALRKWRLHCPSTRK